MKFYTDLNAQEFDEFVYAHPLNHYSKTAKFGEFKTKEGFQYWLCGIKIEDELVATALLQRKNLSLLYGSFAYVSYGYCLDYTNQELLTFMNQNIIKFSQKLKVTFLRIDPNVMRLEHEKDGAIKENGFNNEWLTDEITKMGFQHLGYRYGYSGNWLSRFTYILDLSPTLEEVYQGIKRFGSNFKKNQVRGVEVKEVGLAGLETLYKYQLELAKQESFIPKPLSYFEDLFQAFNGAVKIYEATCDLSQSYLNLENEILDLEKELLNPELKRGLRKQHEINIAGLKRELTWLKDNNYQNAGKISLGAKLIIVIGKKVFNVNMYTLKLTSNFKISWALHLAALTDMKEKGATSYDFEGISGATNKDDLYYGLHEFKKSFGGEYIEYLGEFDYIYQPMRYKMYRKLDVYVSRIKRKLRQIKNRVL